MSKLVNICCPLSPTWHSCLRSRSIILAVGTIAVSLLFATRLLASGELPVAEEPRVLVDTNYRHPSGATFFVGEGGDLQATLNSAEPGDTIVLQAGATFIGNFTLPAKTNPDKLWIYIESS